MSGLSNSTRFRSIEARPADGVGEHTSTPTELNPPPRLAIRHLPVFRSALMRPCTVCVKSPVKGISAHFLRVNLFDAFQRRQFLDGLSTLFFRQPNFVEALKIQPELWTRSEKMS
jgi:hypothetical protein